jgi:hypothetical protein
LVRQQPQATVVSATPQTSSSGIPSQQILVDGGAIPAGTLDNVIHGTHRQSSWLQRYRELITHHPPVRPKAPRPGRKHRRTADRIRQCSIVFHQRTGGYNVINHSFVAASNICNRESTFRGPVRLVLNRAAWAAIAILAFVGCLNFASTDHARAQETRSCTDQCYHEEKVCVYNGGSDDMCKYDRKECLKKCSEQQ